MNAIIEKFNVLIVRFLSVKFVVETHCVGIGPLKIPK